MEAVSAATHESPTEAPITGGDIVAKIDQRILDALINGRLRIDGIFDALGGDVTKVVISNRLPELTKKGLVEGEFTPSGRLWGLAAQEQEEVPDGPDLDAMTVSRTIEIDPDTITEEGVPDELRSAILASIDEGYRSYGAIKKYLGVSPAVDITPVLAALCVEWVLRKEENATTTAYFRYETKPKKFWLTGDGKIEAEWDERFVPRDETAKAKEMAGRDMDADQLAAKAEFEANERKTSGNGPTGVRGKRVIDAERLEKLAQYCKTQDLVAKELGMATPTLQGRLRDDAALRAAYDRGRAARLKDQAPDSQEALSEPSTDAALPEHPSTVKQQDDAASPLTPEAVRELAAAGVKVKEAAERLGIKLTQFKNYIAATRGKYAPIGRAWKEGKKLAPKVPRAKPMGGGVKLEETPATEEPTPAEECVTKDVVPEFEGPVDGFKRPAYPELRSLEIPYRRGIQDPVGFQHTIGFTDLRVTVKVQGNMFAAERADRDRVNDLIDLIREWEATLA